MQNEVMFAGFGGQGILFSAKILAHAALEQGFEVVWIPSYGAEMRGGTAYCMVVISDRPIGSPIVRNPLHLVAMNRPSLEKFAPVVKPGGVIMINSSLISCDAGRQDVDEIKIPVIGIGAGRDVDGQVLVLHDMLGITMDFSPRFLRRYNNLSEEIQGSVTAYINDVKSLDFPNEREQY